jgi:hypothetical protein
MIMMFDLLDKHAKLDLSYNAKLLKQQSAGRHISPLVILILIHVNSSAGEWYAVPSSHKKPVVLLIYQRSQWPTYTYIF